MAFLLPLLLFGLCVTAHLVFGDKEKPKLDCNNDMENIFCQLEAENCSEYSLTIQDDFDHQEYSCPLQQCNKKCCCSSQSLIFTFDNTFTVKVCRGSTEVEGKIVHTSENFKAKAPTIVSVKESNGNLEVRWKTNMEEWFNTEMTAEVTFYKQGDVTEVSKNVTPAMDNGLQFYVISGKDLDSDTEYRIRVRSYTKWNKMYSDSSSVETFQTSPSSDSQVWALILGLSVVAVLLSAFIFCCFLKSKRKWWDKYPEPKVTISHIANQMVLEPLSLEISVCVTEEEMSKKRWDSAVEDDMQPFFPKILQDDKESGCSQDIINKNVSGSGDMFNHTYSLLLSNCSGQKKTGCFEAQSQTEKLSGSVCSPNMSNTMNNPERLAHLFPAQQDRSSLVPTEMSRQWCRDAYPLRVSHSDGSGIFGDINTSAPGELKTVAEGFEMSYEKAFKHETPFYGCLPVDSHRFLSVKADFQPVPSKVEQPDALLLEKVLEPLSLEISVCVTEEEMSKKRWDSAVEDDMQPFFPKILQDDKESGCSQDIINKNVSGSGDMFNHTYSLLLSNCSGQKKTGCFEAQSQTEKLSGSVCSPNMSNTMNNPERLAHLFPAQQDRSSLVPTEMSRQWCRDAYPLRVSHADGSVIHQFSFSPFTPGVINNTQNAQCHPGLLLPFPPMRSADKTIEVIGDYHSV